MRKKIIFLAIFLCLPSFALAKELPLFAHLTWQSQAFVPPFYQGKSLPSSSSQIKVSALVFDKEGKIISSKDLFFSWYLNSQIVDSGFGKVSFSFIDKREKESESLTIVLVLKDKFGRQKELSLSIPFSSPEIIIYPQGSLVSLKKIKKGEEISLTYQTFFFPQWKLVNLKPFWFFGNKLIAENKREIVFKPENSFDSLWLYLQSCYNKIGTKYYSQEVKVD